MYTSTGGGTLSGTSVIDLPANFGQATARATTSSTSAVRPPGHDEARRRVAGKEVRGLVTSADNRMRTGNP
jgi:hypothetical protein